MGGNYIIIRLLGENRKCIVAESEKVEEESKLKPQEYFVNFGCSTVMIVNSVSFFGLEGVHVYGIEKDPKHLIIML